MVVIIYDRREEEREFIIDELSQQIIVYLGFHGSAQCDTVTEYVGADSGADVEERLENKLGQAGARLVQKNESDQMTLDGTEVPPSYSLTEEGNSFVYRHKSVLKTPTELESIAHTVSELKREVEYLPTDLDEAYVEQDDLRESVDRIEDRLTELEARVQSLE
ncbi:hypothetical protein [Haloferax sp. YSSS75]|uniref:hypothetical protein n=1 Tax=Haloferax sp. YSSS75 TaxID=3388564 RepID=UPI00398CB0CF